MNWHICTGKRLEASLTFLLLASLCPSAYAQETATDTGCTVRRFFHETWSETSQFGDGLKAAPRGAVRPSNLKWELPILAATGVLIAKVDRPSKISCRHLLEDGFLTHMKGLSIGGQLEGSAQKSVRLDSEVPVFLLPNVV